MHPTESAAQTPVRPTASNVTTVNENIVNQNPTHLPMPHQTVPTVPSISTVPTIPTVPAPTPPQPQSSAVLQPSPDVEFISFETPKRPPVKHEPMSIDQVDGRFGPPQMPIVPANLNESFTDFAAGRVDNVAETTTKEEF